MRKVVAVAGLLVLMMTVTLTGCTPLSTGLVTGDGPNVMAINLDTDSVIGTVALPDSAVPESGRLNTVVTLNGTVGYVNGADNQAYIVNISETDIALNPRSPVHIPNRGNILTASEQNPWLLVRGYDTTSSTYTLSANNPLDITLEASHVSTPDFFEQAYICDDGETVLLREAFRQRIRLLRLSTTGLLTDTGRTLSLTAIPLWVTCSPGATAGAVMLPVGADLSVVSFTIDMEDGLVEVDSAVSNALESGSPGPINNAVAFSTDGTGLFIRSSSIIGSAQQGWIERFSFNPATAEISAAPEFTAVAGVSYTYGKDQIGVNPDGSRIYLPNNFVAGGRIRILDAISGAVLGSVTHPDMPNPVEFEVTH